MADVRTAGDSSTPGSGSESGSGRGARADVPYARLPEHPERTPFLTLFRLSLMMFLQYAVWGAWLPLAGRFMAAGRDAGGLGFTEWQLGILLGTAASCGAFVAPFIAGQFADRYFRTERFLAFLLIVGGVVQLLMAAQTSFFAWLALGIAYSIVFMPTLALSNALAFAHLRDAERDFPIVRVWGTIGWIAASWAFPWIWLQTGLQPQWRPPFLAGDEVADVTARLIQSIRFSAGIAFVYAAFALFALPATPPKKDRVEPLAFAKAFRLISYRSFSVLLITSLVIATIHQIYFIQTPKFFSFLGLRDSDIGPAMTIGQGSEIIMMALLGLLLKNLGFRWVMFMGCCAYLARYAIWGTTYLPVWVMVSSQFLHGFCYACFFAASYIYVDRIADPDVRNSAQTVYGIMILGGGPVLGGMLSGWLGNLYMPAGGGLDYSSFWYTVAAIGLVATLFFVMFFRDETRRRPAAV